MKLIKKTALLSVLLAALLLQAACLKPVSLDACGYVAAIAIDEGGEGEFYYTLALQRELAGENIESEGGAILLADSGRDVFEAISRMEGSVPYTLNFSRANFIVVSRTLAERGALSQMVFTDRDRLHMRTSAAVVVTECRAFEFLGAMYSNNDADINKLQAALTLDGKRTGMVRLMSLSRLIEAELTGSDDFVTALGTRDEELITDMEQKRAEAEGKDPLENVKTGDRVGGLKAVMTGAALFSGCRMTGSLSRDETLLLNLVLGRLEHGFISFETQNGRMTAALTGASSKLVSKMNNGVLELSVSVSVRAEILKAEPEIPGEQAEHSLLSELPGILGERLVSLLEKLRKAGCDPMGAARRAGAGREEYLSSRASVSVSVVPVG